MDGDSQFLKSLPRVFDWPTGIKFGRGVIGKVSPVIAIAIAALAPIGIVLAWKNPDGLAVPLMIFGLAVIYIVAMVTYAAIRPDAAVLEDAHYVTLRQQQFAAKEPTLVSVSASVPQLIEGEVERSDEGSTRA
jgi:hypothetical protein